MTGTLLLFAYSCSKQKGHIEGQITNAKDSVLYFENLSLDGVKVVDSVRLGEDGKFSFACLEQEAPEFYRLRIASEIISLAVDSFETVNITAQYPGMAQAYEVSGSLECKTIQELSKKQMLLQATLDAVMRNPNLSPSLTKDSVRRIVSAYKDAIKRDYIFKAPYRSSSYYALFETIGQDLLFDPRSSEEDIKAFAAVATSWDVYHPNAIRGKNLHNITIEGMKNVRILRSQSQGLEIEASKVNTSNLIDIRLMSNQGRQRSLTELAGKVVLLDFQAFALPHSTERIMQLREVYNKYASRGFEIYQVSLDEDAHFWKTKSAALPWISVRDESGEASKYLQLYNVQSVPTYFLIDRSNTVVKRDQQIQDLNGEIEKLL